MPVPAMLIRGNKLMTKLKDKNKIKGSLRWKMKILVCLNCEFDIRILMNIRPHCGVVFAENIKCHLHKEAEARRNLLDLL